jgi:hypothetical protein
MRRMKQEILVMIMLVALSTSILTAFSFGKGYVTLALSDSELSTQFAKEYGPGTVTAITDVAGPGVKFDFTGLNTMSGTTVGDDFPVSQLAGGALDATGGYGDFGIYSRYSMMFTNLGIDSVMVCVKMNTGWTDPPWGTPARDTYWQSPWTNVATNATVTVTMEFSSAIVYNAGDDPDVALQYPDGTVHPVCRLNETSDIGFQILANDAGSVVVTGLIDVPMTLTDTELGTQFTKEVGPGTVVAITNMTGTGVRFDFSDLDPSTGTVVGDNFPVSTLANGTWKDYGNGFAGPYDFSAYTKLKVYFANVGTTPVQVNLKLNTGWTIPPPEYAAAWRDTFWQTSWTALAPGENKLVTLDFSSAEVYNAGDEQEFTAHADGTTGVPIWRLDEVSDIGFQVLGTGNASIAVSGSPITLSRALTITTTIGGTTDPTPGTYAYANGASADVTALNDEGYGFDHWEIDSSWNYSNPITVTMDTDHALSAVFNYSVVIEAFCLTDDATVSVNIAMDNSPTGYTTPTTFNLTSTHNFTVPDTDSSGHLFKQWNTGETNTTIPVASSGTFTAYYQANYTLTITTTTGGSTNPPPGDHTYWEGTAVDVTALPSLGYVLDHWELDGFNVGASNPTSLTMDAAHTLHGVFSWVGTCNLTITTTTGGTTNPAPGIHEYTNGTSVQVAAIPDMDYGLDHWEIDGSNILPSNPITVTMDVNHTVNAVFKLTYTLTITTTAGGTTNPSPGTYTYIEGTAVTVTATASTGYGFDHWELDGSNVGSPNPTIVTMDAAHTLHALFTYNATIQAYSNNNAVTLSITMDGSPTGYTTPHTFEGLNGAHTFTVPETDPHGVPFFAWIYGQTRWETSRTITIEANGTYSAYYISLPAPSQRVGGTNYSVDKIALLAPYVGLALIILVATVTTANFVKRHKREEEK